MSTTEDEKEHWRLRLIELIKHLGVTQRQFADETELDPSYVSRLLYPPGKLYRKHLGLETMSAISKCYKLSPGWFDLPLGLDMPPRDGEVSHTTTVAEPDPHIKVAKIAGATAIRWPFKLVSYQRLSALQRGLGAKAGPEAIRDIDKHLDLIVERWERDLSVRPHKRATR